MNWDAIAESCRVVTDEIMRARKEEILAVAAEMVACLRAGGKVMFCGNGGSASDAQHFAGELVNRFLIDRAPFAGLALTTDTSVLSSIGNDFGFAEVFEKQVQALGREGDILFCISTSGNAENVLRACAAAKARGVRTVGLTGGTGGELAKRVDRLIRIESSRSTPRIQEGHHLVMHLLCEKVEEDLVAGQEQPQAVRE